MSSLLVMNVAVFTTWSNSSNGSREAWMYVQCSSLAWSRVNLCSYLPHFYFSSNKSHPLVYLLRWADKKMKYDFYCFFVSIVWTYQFFYFSCCYNNYYYYYYYINYLAVFVEEENIWTTFTDENANLFSSYLLNRKPSVDMCWSL